MADRKKRLTIVKTVRGNVAYKKVFGGSNPEMTIAFAGNPNDKISLGGMGQEK